MSNNVILVRGAPGSGKSTFARKNFPKHILIEADDYFMINNKYHFDYKNIKDAHKWCQWRFSQLHKNGQSIIVANTFTKLWEMEHYLNIAPNAVVYRCTGEWNNIHGVSESKVREMRDRIEAFQGEIIVNK